MLRKLEIRLSSCVMCSSTAPPNRGRYAHTFSQFHSKRAFTRTHAADSRSRICQDYISALDLTTGTFTSRDSINLRFYNPPHINPHSILLKTSGGRQGVAQNAIDYSWRNVFGLPFSISGEGVSEFWTEPGFQTRF